MSVTSAPPVSTQAPMSPAAGPALQTSTLILNKDTYLEGVPVFSSRAKSIAASNITGTMEYPTIGMASTTESVYPVLLGVSVIAVFVMILLIMIVVLRFMAHQKGTYYTHEETLAFKSDPEVQEVTEDVEDPEDQEEEEP